MLAFFCACNPARQADPQQGVVTLDQVDFVLNASRNTEFLIAPASLDLAAIRERREGWRRNEKPVFDQGFSTDVYWLRLSVRNRTGQDKWYVTLRNNRLNFVDFFLVSDAGVQSYRTGDRRPLPPDAPTSYPAFEFRLAPGSAGTLFVRIESDTHISFPVRFYNPEEFGSERNQTMILHLLYAALYLVFVVFQVRLNPTVRGSLEWFLILAVGTGFMWLLVFYGEGARLFWPDWIWGKNNLNYVGILSFTTFFTFFLPQYMRLKEFYPRLNLTFYIHGSLAALAVVSFCSFPIPNKVKSDVTNILILGMYALMMVGIVQSLRKKQYWVLFLLSSWIFMTIAALAQTLMLSGFLPYNSVTHNSSLVTFPVDVGVIAVSMIIRHRTLVRERDELRGRLEALDRTPGGQERDRKVRNLDVKQTVYRLVDYFAAEKPYLEEEISLERVARRLDLRPDQLSAVINKELKTSFSGLIKEYRVREARRLMQAEPDMNLLRIAFECGFGSRSSFNRAFKELTDLPPVEYRRRLADGNDPLAAGET